MAGSSAASSAVLSVGDAILLLRRDAATKNDALFIHPSVDALGALRFRCRLQDYTHAPGIPIAAFLWNVVPLSNTDASTTTSAIKYGTQVLIKSHMRGQNLAVVIGEVNSYGQQELSLLPSEGPETIWQLLPGSRARVKGQPVHVHDPVVFVHVATGASIQIPGKDENVTTGIPCQANDSCCKPFSS